MVCYNCKWICTNYRGQNATVKNDKWGFTFANFEPQIPFGPKSIALPVHVDQVFFCNAHDEPGWKVILKKEIQGKHIFQIVGVSQEQGMF
jgi:hypothetical protein